MSVMSKLMHCYESKYKKTACQIGEQLESACLPADGLISSTRLQQRQSCGR